MTTEKKAELFAAFRLVEALVVIITAPILLGLGAWAMATIVRHDGEISVLKSESSLGPRYTAEMAKEDFQGVLEKIGDHELRIRVLEKIPR
jgi:hypothetical protein